MMKMATSEGSPSGRVPEQGPDWFLVAIEACGCGSPNLLCSWTFGGIWVYIGERSRSGEPRGAHEGGGHAQGVGAPPVPRALLVAFLTWTSCPLDHVRFENHVPEGFIPFGLRLIFFFCETLK